VRYKRSCIWSLAEATLTLTQLNMPVLMYDKDGKSTVMTLEQLLPLSFGPEKLLTTEELQNGLSQ
jgi:cytidine deaminase